MNDRKVVMGMLSDRNAASIIASGGNEWQKVLQGEAHQTGVNDDV